MAIGIIALFPGGTKAQFDAVVEEMGDGHSVQPERIVFAAGAVDEGWQIVQVWRDQSAFERLVQEHLRPAMERVGERGFPTPSQVRIFAVEELWA